MLSENLKKARNSKGLSQEELAIKLNVVRQTVSKWEKGLSVPDSKMLIKIARELDTAINDLLGVKNVAEENLEFKEMSAKLEILTEQLAKKNETRRKALRILSIVLAVSSLIAIIFITISLIHHQSVLNDINKDISIIGGSDAPTNIYVSNISFRTVSFVAVIATAFISAVGIYKTRRK